MRLGEARGAGHAQRTGFEARPVQGNGAAAMRQQNLQRGEILEHIRIQQRHHGDAFLIDEMQRIRQAVGAAAGGVDMARNVELDQFFVERIPVAIAQRRGLDAAGLTGIGIDQAADEAELL